MRNLSFRFLSIALLAAMLLQAPLAAEVCAAPGTAGILATAPSARGASFRGGAASEAAAGASSRVRGGAETAAGAEATKAYSSTLAAAPAAADAGRGSELRASDSSRGVAPDVIREGTLVRSGSRLRYRHSNGTYARSAWVTTGGKTYYFNKNANAVTGLRRIGSYYYIFNSKGVLQKGWIKYRNRWYYGSVNKRGRLLTAWQKIGGKRYYISVKTLYRLTGFQYIGRKIYYFNAKGVQQTKDQTVKGKKVVFNKDGSVYSYGSRVYGTYSTYKGQQVANYALRFVGNPYVWGGSSLTHGADCSGFVMAVYAHFGVQLPHYDAWIRQRGRAVNGLANALPGDVICYDGHVAIYLGGGRIVHAADYQYGICVWDNAAYRQILSIRRFF